MHDYRQSAGEPHLRLHAGAAAIRIAQRFSCERPLVGLGRMIRRHHRVPCATNYRNSAVVDLAGLIPLRCPGKTATAMAFVSALVHTMPSFNAEAVTKGSLETNFESTRFAATTR
jgi:hypothetical protein